MQFFNIQIFKFLNKVNSLDLRRKSFRFLKITHLKNIYLLLELLLDVINTLLELIKS